MGLFFFVFLEANSVIDIWKKSGHAKKTSPFMRREDRKATLGPISLDFCSKSKNERIDIFERERISEKAYQRA